MQEKELDSSVFFPQSPVVVEERAGPEDNVRISDTLRTSVFLSKAHPLGPFGGIPIERNLLPLNRQASSLLILLIFRTTDLGK